MNRHLLLLPLLAGAVGACAESPAAPGASGEIHSLVIVSGAGQTGAAGEELPAALVVRALDAGGNPAAGRPVGFRVVAGGGSTFLGVGISDAEGIVRDYWTLGRVAGDSQRVEARSIDPVTGEKQVLGIFTATAVTGAPHVMRAITGMPSGVVGQYTKDAVKVVLYDRFENQIRTADIRVHWAPSGDGGVHRTTTRTDTAGVAGVGWQFGTVAGEQSLTASLAAGPAVSISGRASPDVPAVLQVSADSIHFNALQTDLYVPVTATDRYGNAVSWFWSATYNSTFDIFGKAIRSKGNGSGWVIAHAGSLRDTVRVVVWQEVASLVFNPLPPTTISKGTVTGEFRQSLRVRDPKPVLVVRPYTVAWTSSNPSVASVDSLGKVTVHAAGTFTITATVEGVSVTSATVTVP